MYPAIKFRPVNQLRSKAGHELPLRSTQLRASARGGIASVLLTQLFENPYDEVLTVTYTLPLPADAAVSGFAIVLQDRRIVGEVDRKANAKARYRRAIREGQSAALMEQARSSLFTQEVGNIPPRESITIEILLDQRLQWLPEGLWEWRFPTVVAPRYQGAQALSYTAQPPSLSATLLIDEPLSARGEATSPSHDITARAYQQKTQVSLAQDAPKDRDLVVRWPASRETLGASLGTFRPELGGLDHLAFGLLTLLPPEGESEVIPRDLILLLDISGSMAGAPLQQMKEVSHALITTLSARDQLEVIAFSSQPKHWRRGAVYATEEVKAEALRWLDGLQANGGTELKAGLIAALSSIRPEAQRQVILMTDGLISAEHEIVQEIYERLPLGSRVHTLGIGSAVNRSLTAPVARAGAGVEQIVGLEESAERAAARLVARTAAPLVVGLKLGGSALLEACPSRLPDLYAGSPALLSLRLRPEGGELTIEGSTNAGAWRQAIQVAPLSPGEGAPEIAALYAREAVEDVELALAAGRPQRAANQQIEDLGIAFQISTRLTSWIARSEEITVESGAPGRREEIPQERPAGMVTRTGFEGVRAWLRRRSQRADAPTRDAATSIRNLMITGALEAGQTTLIERILYQASLSVEDEALDPEHATMDWMEMERERGISIQYATSTCEWEGCELNLIRQPLPAPDFVVGCAEQAAEGALVVVAAVPGLTAQSAPRLKRPRLPCLLFLNKLDRAESDWTGVYAQLKERLGLPPLCLQLPMFSDEGFEGVIDLVEQRAYYSGGSYHDQSREEAIPAALQEEARAQRQRLLEAVADVDDLIAEAFLEERAVSSSQLKAGIRRACLAQKGIPVFLGAAFRSKGLQRLLQGIIEYLPSPREVTHEVHDPQGKSTALTPSTEGPFVGQIFAVERSYWGELAYLRAYQGQASNGDILINQRTGQRQRSTRMLRMGNTQQESVAALSAGSIAALTGMTCAVGDTLTHEGFSGALAAAPPEALLFVRVTSKEREEQRKVEQAARLLARKDPTLRVRAGEGPYQTIIAGIDEVQLELALEHLWRERRGAFSASKPQLEPPSNEAGADVEPIMEVEVFAPEKLQGVILGQLNQRRGVITDLTLKDGALRLTAEAPLGAMLGYHNELRATTQGKGDLTMRFLRYDPT